MLASTKVWAKGTLYETDQDDSDSNVGMACCMNSIPGGDAEKSLVSGDAIEAAPTARTERHMADSTLESTPRSRNARYILRNDSSSRTGWLACAVAKKLSTRQSAVSRSTRIGGAGEGRDSKDNWGGSGFFDSRRKNRSFG